MKTNTKQMIIAKLDNIEFKLSFGTLDSPPKESYIGNPSQCKGSTSYVCIDGDQVIGVLVVGRSRSGMTVTSNGTIVRSSRRKDGIARDLWVAMLKAEKPKRMSVRVVSDRGLSLVESVKEEFPKVKWLISRDGSRKLRRLSYK